MKKYILYLTVILLSGYSIFITGCAPSKAIQDKSGAQLWGENCNRCHTAPSLDQYSKDHWDVIGTHMKTKALLTHEETKKIVEFLQSSN